MYKTVRQGENSLQYTILPQTEEVLTNSGVKGKGRDYSPSSHSRRLNKKLMVYYMAIVFFGLLLTFGTLLFALVLCGILPIDLPSHLNTLKRDQPSALKSTIPCSTVEPDKSPAKKKELGVDVKISLDSTTAKTLIILLNKTLEKIKENNTLPVAEIDSKDIFSSPVAVTTEQEQKIPVFRTQSSTTIIPSVKQDDISTLKTIEKLSSPYVRQRESNGDLMINRDQNYLSDYDDDDDDDDDDENDMGKLPVTQSIITKKFSDEVPEKVNIKVTELTPTTAIYASVDNYKEATNKPVGKPKSKMDMAKFQNMKERLLDDDDEEYKESSTDEDDVSVQDDVKMSQAKTSWLQTRWPFVDPSSYFQWTGYSARDNLLLPAILSAALSALLVLAILCYALRRKQRCKRRLQEIGNLTSDLQAEDNAILLTAENPSEED